MAKNIERKLSSLNMHAHARWSTSRSTLPATRGSKLFVSARNLFIFYFRTETLRSRIFFVSHWSPSPTVFVLCLLSKIVNSKSLLKLNLNLKSLRFKLKNHVWIEYLILYFILKNRIRDVKGLFFYVILKELQSKFDQLIACWNIILGREISCWDRISERIPKRFDHVILRPVKFHSLHNLFFDLSAQFMGKLTPVKFSKTKRWSASINILIKSYFL